MDNVAGTAPVDVPRPSEGNVWIGGGRHDPNWTDIREEQVLPLGSKRERKPRSRAALHNKSDTHQSF